MTSKYSQGEIQGLGTHNTFMPNEVGTGSDQNCRTLARNSSAELQMSAGNSVGRHQAQQPVTVGILYDCKFLQKIGRHLVGVWIGGVWNGHFPESEKIFRGQNFQENP